MSERAAHDTLPLAPVLLRREKQLQLAGLQAFRHAVACAREERRLARLQVRSLHSWRLLAASSGWLVVRCCLLLLGAAHHLQTFLLKPQVCCLCVFRPSLGQNSNHYALTSALFAARHWAYEAARRHRQRHLLRLALRAWRAAAEATAGQLACFWLRWQVQAVLRHALRGWRCAAAAEHEARVLGGMAEVHRERRLLQGGLDAFAGNAQAARSGRATSASSYSSGRSGVVVLHRRPSPLASPGRQQQAAQHSQQQQQQHVAGQRIATVSVSLGSRQQQRQGATTTISISTQHGAEQEQVSPASAGFSLRDGGSCVPAVAEAARGMLDAVSSWRAAAEHWRQRHQTFSQQSTAAAAAAAAISPHMFATLAEVRTQQQQR